MQLTFLGATGTVTGSKYLLQHNSTQVLVDCGLFQGYKQLRLRNWQSLPIPVDEIDAVVLTHAHLDHSGYLPVLVRNGFRGPIYATAATCELVRILLLDSGRLQEEEADYANRRGYSKHHPAQALYTEEEAKRALAHLRPLELHHSVEIVDGLQVYLRSAGHILGAATVEINAGGQTIVFSGDLGRPNDPIMRTPELIENADILLVESTYGDRQHPKEAPETYLANVINQTLLRHGITLVPSFAVGRAQLLMYYLYALKREHRIPDIPVYLNSPMASDTTALYQRFHQEHRLSAEECAAMCRSTHIIRTVDESKHLDQLRDPAVIIAASGMATGGRVLHHLKALAPNPRNTLLFSGFQAGGTRGADITAGVRTIRMHGEDVPIRAQVSAMESLSAHADADEIMQWLRGFKRPPRHTFVVHGEPHAADTLRRRISLELGWSVSVPEHLETVEL
ncbi:MBL fold metallo-hydrolase [Pseudomonas sp. BIGb0427]|uniref:MBL fold metallo-hydrolase RNA specificity domain-containing protein n=1 Tax=unclassified Pseudomonas TaxID=196821 RepID=UPI000F9A2BC8|nr:MULTISPECIES: MBL fold metallo-hydrolase [unclassified Pseudomonas]QPG61916.1 MBL fold metallo-hydrolase [Pseudomonas sp. BIGb0427]UVM69396.1 MBL fold metallo-hydrolase [Pseudomonas sp. B21-009]